MSPAQLTMIVMGGFLLAVVAVRMFGKSLPWAACAGFHSLAGLALLIALDLLPLGIHLGVSLQNVLVVGLLGLPGFSLLLLFPWILG